MVRPPPPRIELECRARLPNEGPGFLQLERRECVARHQDGQLSEPFTYDTIRRRSLHAAVVVAHFAQAGQCHVYLRSCVRPPLGFEYADPALAAAHHGLWELPAGLIDEEGPFESAARRCAARELLEEVGLDVPEERFTPLGSFVYPLPGVIAERQAFFEVRVDPALRQNPVEDGSPLERAGQVLVVTLEDALVACQRGELPDAKTELGLRRFKDLWESRK